MKPITFDQKISNTINNGNTTIDELKAIEPIIIENCRSSVKLMYNYYFVTIILTVIWFLIYYSVVSEINVLDVKINNKNILLLGIPIVSVLSYYITMSYMAFNQLSDAALKQIHTRIYPNISSGSMMDMLIYPSIIEVESIKIRLSKESLWDTIQFLFVVLSFVFLPVILNGIICYYLLVDFYNSKIILVPIFCGIILLKIVSNFVFFFRQVN